MPSEGLDDPPWNAFNPWLRLSIGDGPPYQLNRHSREFFNAACEGIDRAEEAGRRRLWLGSFAIVRFAANSGNIALRMATARLRCLLLPARMRK